MTKPTNYKSSTYFQVSFKIFQEKFILGLKVFRGMLEKTDNHLKTYKVLK